MESNLTLSTQQRLRQRLTPMQVRYVRMLEMNGPEFEEEIRKALDEMPALEADSPATPDAPPTEDGEQFAESEREMQMADYRSDDDIPDYLRSKQMRREQSAQPDDYYEPVIAAGGDSLADYLLKQLNEGELTEGESVIANYIIGNLDDNGYLTRTPQAIADDIAFTTGENFSTEQVRRVWDKIRLLDPPGIAATDLRDCLILQLERLPKSAPSLTALEIVRHYFDLLAKKHYPKIMAALDIDDQMLREALDVITHLNPKPASLLETTGGGAARAVIPDFMVEVNPDETLTLTMLNRVPELSVEQTFAEGAPLPKGSSRNADAAHIFLKQRRDEALDFIKIVKLRQQTLFTVMSAILKFQRKFFLTEDESEIKPMVLRELSEATGLDISVISRAVRGKYVMTPRGIYPLKMFFNERRTKDTDPYEEEDNTTPRIIAAIGKVIREEDKRKPLSDEMITQMLTAQGFDIARRTVAKYREKLGFPVARLRKQL